MVDYASLPGFGPMSYSPEQVVVPERQHAEAVLREIPGVHGVGEGRDGIGNPSWIAYVQDESVLQLLPQRVGDRDVVAAITGEISALPA